MEKPVMETVPLRELSRDIVTIPSIMRMSIKERQARRMSSREVRSDVKGVVTRSFALIVRWKKNRKFMVLETLVWTTLSKLYEKKGRFWRSCWSRNIVALRTEEEYALEEMEGYGSMLF